MGFARTRWDFAPVVKAALVLACGWWLFSCARPAQLHHDSGEWGAYDLWLPAGEVKALVFLFSPETGIASEDRAAATALTRAGAAVAVVDTRVYLQRMGGVGATSADQTCLDVPGAFLWTSHMLQKELRLPVYRPAYLIGRGTGSALVYVALAQSPPRAFAGGRCSASSAQRRRTSPCAPIPPRPAARSYAVREVITSTATTPPSEPSCSRVSWVVYPRARRVTELGLRISHRSFTSAVAAGGSPRARGSQPGQQLTAIAPPRKTSELRSSRYRGGVRNADDVEPMAEWSGRGNARA